MLFNFDLIFTGTDEEQTSKADKLITGLKQLKKESSAAFAEYVVKGDSNKALSHLGQVQTYTKAEEALRADARLDALIMRNRSADVEQLVKEVIASSPVLSALDQIVRSKNKAPAPSEEPQQQPEAQQ